jgi:TRAP-type uncharacterized transport system fused permease subunit
MSLEESNVEAPHRGPLLWLERLSGTLIVLLSIGYAGDLHRYLGVSIYDAQLLAAGLTLALTTGFLAIARTSVGSLLKVGSLLAAAVTLGVGFYLAIDYINITMEAPYLPFWLVALSGVVLAALMLNVVPSVGMGIFVVVLLFMAYGLFGHLMPGEFRSRETMFSELAIYLATDANGMLGQALKVAVVIVVPYLLFGKLLSACVLPTSSTTARSR